MTLLTVREVAARLRLGKSTVYLLIQRGDLPAVRFGSSVRVPEALFEKWLSEKVQGDPSSQVDWPAPGRVTSLGPRC